MRHTGSIMRLRQGRFGLEPVVRLLVWLVLLTLLPAAAVGYRKTDAPHVEKDSGRRVREAVTLVFRKFGELGTVRQTLGWFLEQGVQLPVQNNRSTRPESRTCRPSYSAHTYA